jgi:ubiquinone/menaquinone biosynthesis C-methylase UbiE
VIAVFVWDRLVPMGFYRDRIFARVMNRIMNTKETRRIRAEVCAPLHGDVIEIGFGTGLNLPHIPAAVTRLRAVDPLETGPALARERLAASSVPVEFIGLDGQRIPLDDQCMDAALCTWTLCSIPEPVLAVQELKRVLRPGGTLHFVEHGASPDAKVRRWQDRMNGLQQRLACGCNLNRDMPSIVEAGGFEITSLDTYYAKGDPKHQGWTFQGVATA